MRQALHASLLQELPRNFSELRDEIADGMGSLFGSAARAQYLAEAEWQFTMSLQHPLVKIYGVHHDKDLAGLLFALMVNAQAVRIPFYHVLTRYTELEVAPLLVSHATDDLLRGGITHIVAECVPIGPACFHDAFTRCGFRSVLRLVMVLDKENYHPLLDEAGPLSTPFLESSCEAVGDLLVEVYRNHPDRAIHVDLQQTSDAIDFVQTVFGGGYGRTKPSYLRGVWRDDRLTGLILGSEISSECGFVLHVAVHPDYQQKGLGTRLMSDLLGEFFDSGFQKVALAVTASSPAVLLYKKLGFVPVKSYETYIYKKEST